MADFISHGLTESRLSDDVEKEIKVEAPTDTWRQPQTGDVVIVEVGTAERDARDTRSWIVGDGEPLAVAGVDVDRCVRTMRQGEEATVRLKSGEANSAFPLRLLAIERNEDLLGTKGLMRLSVQEGKNWQTPQAGMELRVRYSWRAVRPVGSIAEAQGAATSPPVVVLGGALGPRSQAAASSALADLRQLLFRHFGVVAMVRSEDLEGKQELKGPILRIMRGDSAFLDWKDGVSADDALLATKAIVLPALAEAGCTARREAREVLMRVGEDSIECDAEDWIPGPIGRRALSDVRAGQRCFVEVAPELAFGASGLPDFGVPPGATLEYDVEVLQLMTLEDVSLDYSGTVMKKTTRSGEGYARPVEGAEVKVRLEAHEDAGGAVLVEEREVTFAAGSGRFCSAFDETVLTMKKGETCEVRCAASAAASCVVDEELGLRPRGGGVSVVLCLELIEFQQIDLHSSDEAERVAHCARRKEVGARFYQKSAWRRALKRYQHVTNTLMYLDHWKDASARAEASALRRLCHSNAAACWLKLEAWREAEQSCQSVLAEEPENVKALFRRGLALKELHEYREAERSFRKVHDLDPENKEAPRMLVRIRQLVKDEAEKQKDMFSKMAKGIGSAVQAPQEEEQTPGPDSVQAATENKVPADGALATESDSADDILWPMVGATAALLACAALGVFLARRWRK